MSLQALIIKCMRKMPHMNITVAVMIIMASENGDQFSTGMQLYDMMGMLA